MTGDYLAAPLHGAQIGDASTDFVVVEWSDDGGGEHEWIAPLHVHHEDDEAWYVLQGVLRFRVGNDRFEARPGSAVLAPRGVPHTYGNARSGETARYLLVMTPRIRALVAALHEPDVTDPLQLFRDHASELLA